MDINLEKFFDKVNHDKLMNLVAREIRDKRVLKLIGKYLRAGVMENGVIVSTEEGTPQGSPLSPLLSNIMLNELDKELEKRGHKFCRYADDCNIYVKSQKAAERVMKGISDYIEKKLKLKVNKEKSAVGKATERKFLGFSFYQKDGETKIRVHPKSIKKLKEKVKRITSRRIERKMEARIKELNHQLRGWINYFRLAEMKRNFEDIDGWIRRRLRMCYWKQWKKPKTRRKNLLKLGAKEEDSWGAYSRKGYWRIAGSPILTSTLTNQYFSQIGFRSLSSQCSL